MSVEKVLRQARLAAGLTQADLAVRAGTSQAAVARYEAGDVSPSVSTLERLLRAAGAQLVLHIESAPAANIGTELAAHVRRNRSEIKKVIKQHGGSNVRMFGSVARGEATAESDIDFLIDFDLTAGLLPIASMRAELADLLGRPVDVAPVDLLKTKVARNALREAIPL